MATFNISAGSKLSYGTMNGSAFPTSWTDIAGLTEIPEIGGAPETVETTTLDNLTYRTYTDGLQDLGTLDFPFNLETPAASANINLIAGLTKTTEYAWKITYASGVVIKFKSKPSYSFNAVGVNEIESFTLHLTPSAEPTIEIPSASI